MIKDIINSFIILDHKDRLIYLALLTGITFGALMEVISIYLIYKLIMVVKDNSFLSDESIKVIDISFLELEMYLSFSNFIILIISIFTFKFIYFLTLYYGKYSFVNHTRVKISSLMLKSYLKKKFKFYNKKNSSVLIRNIESEVGQYTLGVLTPLLVLFSEVIMFSGILLFLLVTNPSIIISCFFLLFFISQVYFLYIKKILVFHGKQRQENTSKALNSLMETFQGLRVLKIFNAENFFYLKFLKYSKKLARSNVVIGSLSHVPKFGLEFFVVIIICTYLIILSSNNTNNTNQFTFETLALFAISAFKLIPSISRIVFSLQNVRFNKVSANIILSERHNLYKQENLNKNLKPFHFRNRIEFKDVEFRYPLSKQKIFNKTNFVIQRGSSIGIVGDSGVGKSTLINLIMGFISPTKGEILIDGINLNKIKYQWMKIIGYVPQKLFLINENINKNIAFGKEEHEINLKRVDQSINLSEMKNQKNNARDLFRRNLGEEGTQISGGQMQRISIARSIYKDPDIYIFDEATNSLDKNTEKRILKTIKKITKNKTLLIISHKKETLKFCDTILSITNNTLKKIK